MHVACAPFAIRTPRVSDAASCRSSPSRVRAGGARVDVDRVAVARDRRRDRDAAQSRSSSPRCRRRSAPPCCRRCSTELSMTIVNAAVVFDEAQRVAGVGLGVHERRALDRHVAARVDGGGVAGRGRRDLAVADRQRAAGVDRRRSPGRRPACWRRPRRRSAPARSRSRRRRSPARASPAAAICSTRTRVQRQLRQAAAQRRGGQVGLAAVDRQVLERHRAGADRAELDDGASLRRARMTVASWPAPRIVTSVSASPTAAITSS